MIILNNKKKVILNNKNSYPKSGRNLLSKIMNPPKKKISDSQFTHKNTSLN